MKQDIEESRDYDPAKDPFACSGCGCALGMSDRVAGRDYCSGCRKEVLGYES